MLSNINLQPIVQFFHTYPHSGGIIAFIVVFLEALAVVGSVVPGAITMPTLGFLIGSATISAGSTFFWAVCGALTGDYISYLIGVYFQDRLHKLWPFRKHPKLLEKSQKFFQDHGGKSIFLGRFIGPMRAMIPIVAGMLKMRQSRFILAAIPSAIIWVAVYMLPGIVLGALSLELPPKAATKFTLYVLLAVVLAWVGFWLTHLFFKRLCIIFDYFMKKAWEFMQRQRATRWFTVLLADPREPDNHSQLTLLVLAIFSATLFLVVFFSILYHGILIEFNGPIYHLLNSIRFKSLDYLMIGITMLGDEKVMILAAFLILIYMLIKRYWYLAINWFALVALCGAAISDFKKQLFSARPPHMMEVLHTSSFPSGHTALTLTLFGFLAVVIARELPKNQRSLPYRVVGILVLLVAFSRLYLGAHWITDIAGSIFASLTIILLITVSYRRKHTITFSAKKFSMIIVGIFCVAWIVYAGIGYKKYYKDYQLPNPVVFNTAANWNIQKANLPLYRLNRLGYPIQAFNVQWIGDLQKIRQSFIKQGWLEQPVKLDLKGILSTFSIDSVSHHFPLLPQQYHNHSPVLLLTKSTDQNSVLLILTLWQSDVILRDNTSPLWIGSIELHRASPKVFSLHHPKNKAPFIGATDWLQKYLKEFQWRQVVYPPSQQPEEMLDLHWDGKLILIK